MSRPSRGTISAAAAALARRYGRPRRARRRPLLDVLVETVLSQNTNDRNSHRAYLALRRRFPRWDLVMDAPVRAVAAPIASGGLANIKAVRIKALLSEFARRFGRPTLEPLRRLPAEDAYRYLLSLAGVGPKTAACTLLFGQGTPIFPVDTHIARISQRLGWARPGETPAAFQERFRRLVPDRLVLSLHLNLIAHGRAVCHPGRPACPACPIQRHCTWHHSKERS
ncbi:MAG: endonuclease III [Candidatus Edwardsbacteria bacterium]|jgi:endonuclease-3|nr:endonuclease III [Candidatus Edwardsbacteria bacterium]